jgi:hypothetical protein
MYIYAFLRGRLALLAVSFVGVILASCGGGGGGSTLPAHNTVSTGSAPHLSPQGCLDANGNPCPEKLFVANFSLFVPATISVYTSPFTGPPTQTFQAGLPVKAMAIDQNTGNLFIANHDANRVIMLTPPYAGVTPIVISNSLSLPNGVAVNSSGDLFVSEDLAGLVNEYAPPYTGAPIAQINGSDPSDHRARGLAFDANDNLFVAYFSIFGTEFIKEYAPPYTGPPATEITSNVMAAESIGVDAAGDLFANDILDTGLQEYPLPYAGSNVSTIATIPFPFPFGEIAVDAPGNVFLARPLSNQVTEYIPPYASTLPVSITNGVHFPTAVAIYQ